MNFFPHLLGLFVGLLFCQVWWDFAQITVRTEDVLAIVLISNLILPMLLTGKLRLPRNPLNLPLIVWSITISLGVLITLLSPFDGVTHKDALVNGARLVLGIGMFYVVVAHKTPANTKLKAIVASILAVSIATTTVALLQIGYWDGWFPLRLPDVLVTFKEGANTEKGREIFALYIGDTGSHTWSGMLAMQALLVWVVLRYVKRRWMRILTLLYFSVMVAILVRISVRNSILGLLIAIAGVEVLRGRCFTGKIIRIVVIALAGAGLLLSLFYLAPDAYFIERIRQAIPRFEGGKLVVHPGSNVYGRLDYWSAAVKIFASAPLTGTGFYSYRVLSGLFLPYEIVHAHNSLFHTLAEFGLIGLIVLVWLTASTICLLYRIRRVLGPGELLVFWWEFVTGSLLFSAFVSMFDNHLYLPTPVAFRLVALGVLVSLAKENSCNFAKT